MNGSLCLVSRSLPPCPPNFPLQPGRLVVGRSSDCDLVLPHDSVSRQHAEIHLLNEDVTVVDLDSRNGTFVNDTRIQSSALAVGQRVKFGRVAFLLVRLNPEDEHLDSNRETADDRDGDQAELPAAAANRLSPAQRSVVRHLLDGLSEKETAERLLISPHTVHNHVRDIYAVFGVHSRAELLALLLKE
jgi:pSer/pThr/pTyr-binding forkhead associated (FHA) protein